MEVVINFFKENVFLIVTIHLSVMIISFLMMHNKLKKRFINFPNKEDVQIEFEEKTSSGRSHKSFITKIGGASRCLCITVTNNELWITTFKLFRIFSVYYDLEHRIPLSQISHIEVKEKMVLISFKPKTLEHKLEMHPNDIDRFISALKKGNPLLDSA